MFIDITRYGGARIMRLAIGAIAYLDACEGGTSIHLLGGGTLRVNEAPDEIEIRCAPPVVVPEPDADERAMLISEASTGSQPIQPPMLPPETRPVRSKRRGR